MTMFSVSLGTYSMVMTREPVKLTTMNQFEYWWWINGLKAQAD